MAKSGKEIFNMIPNSLSAPTNYNKSVHGKGGAFLTGYLSPHAHAAFFELRPDQIIIYRLRTSVD